MFILNLCLISFGLAQPLQIQKDLQNWEKGQKVTQDVQYQSVFYDFAVQGLEPFIIDGNFAYSNENPEYILNIGFQKSKDLSSSLQDFKNHMNSTIGYKICFPNLDSTYSIVLNSSNLDLMLSQFGLSKDMLRPDKTSIATLKETTYLSKVSASKTQIFLDEDSTGKKLYSSIRNQIDEGKTEIIFDLYPVPNKRPISLKIRTSDKKEIEIPVEVSGDYTQDIELEENTRWKMRGTDIEIAIDPSKKVQLQMLDSYLKGGKVHLQNLKNKDHYPKHVYTDLTKVPIDTHMIGENNTYYGSVRSYMQPQISFQKSIDSKLNCRYDVNFYTKRQVYKIHIKNISNETWKEIQDIQLTNPNYTLLKQEYLQAPDITEWTADEEKQALLLFDERIFRKMECKELEKSNVVKKVSVCNASLEYKNDAISLNQSKRLSYSEKHQKKEELNKRASITLAPFESQKKSTNQKRIKKITLPTEIYLDFIKQPMPKIEPKLTEEDETNVLKKESEVKELEVKQPVVKEPEIKEPEIKESEVKEPEIKELEVKQPEVKEPEIKEPNKDNQNFIHYSQVKFNRKKFPKYDGTQKIECKVNIHFSIYGVPKEFKFIDCPAEIETLMKPYVKKWRVNPHYKANSSTSVEFYSEIPFVLEPK